MIQPFAVPSAHNGGIFSRTEALRTGLSAAEIRRNLRGGCWIRLRRGIYVTRETLDAYLGAGQYHALEIGAAIRALVIPAMAASHHSAARVYGLELLGSVSADVCLTVQPRRERSRNSLPGVTLHRATLPDAHVVQRAGIPVTTPARAVIDIARAEPFRNGVVACDSALRAGVTDAEALQRALRDCRGWPWVTWAQRVVAFADAKAESVFESLSRVVFVENGLPAPRTQVVLGDERGPIGRSDFYWDQYRTVGEADGMLKYADATTLRQEKLRQENLEEAGYEVVRFTWPQITREPVETVRRIRQAFARGSRRR